MDVFNQNWNQRMQSDPYVNFVLNSDDRVETHETHIKYWTVYATKKPAFKIPKDVIEKNGIYYRKRKSKFTAKNIRYADKQDKKLPKDLRKKEYKWSEPIHYKELHDNTRPQSLYNLRYASLR